MSQPQKTKRRLVALQKESRCSCDTHATGSKPARSHYELAMREFFFICFIGLAIGISIVLVVAFAGGF